MSSESLKQYGDIAEKHINQVLQNNSNIEPTTQYFGELDLGISISQSQNKSSLDTYFLYL